MLSQAQVELYPPYLCGGSRIFGVVWKMYILVIDYFSIIYYGGVCFNDFFRRLGQYDLDTNVCFNLTDPSLQPLSLAKVFVF
jgi:hypothetical protein